MIDRHLHIATPLIWTQTDELRRTVEAVVQNSDRRVYRMDAIDGFVVWTPASKEWKQVLIEVIDPDTREVLEVPTHDLGIAIQQVYEEKNVLIIEHAHTLLSGPNAKPEVVALLSAIGRKYTEAVIDDNAEKVPATFILASYGDEIPPELARDIVKIPHVLPEEPELRQMIRHILDSSHLDMNENEVTHLVRAGLGMGEYEFFHASMQSILANKKVDPEFVNKVKTDKLKANGILEIRMPNVRIDQVGGLDKAKELFRRASWIWDHPEEAAEMDLDEPLRRIMLVGVPGTGKSYICEAAASMMHMDLAKFGVSQMMNKFVGESERRMREAFRQVAALAPIMLWIDELGRDLAGGESSSEVDGGTTSRVHGEYLQGLQELPRGVFIVAAANNIDNLPPEMTRAERWDKILFVGFPSAQERAEIFRVHLGHRADEYDLEVLAKGTEYHTGAEIKALIKETRFIISGDHHRPPVTEDFLRIAPTLKNRVWIRQRDLVKKMYTRAIKEWEWASSQQEAEARDLITGNSGKASAVDLDNEVDKVFNNL